jgi:hypothetical protein
LFSPATLTVSADASDADGSVAKVEFFANGTLIGSATASPYRVIWDAVAAGNYAVVARATDDRGATSNSAAVNVTVSGPTLSLDSALSGATIDDDRVLVRGNVSAPANSAVTINGVVTHIDDSGQFLANDVPLTPGTNTVVAIVITQDGTTFTDTLALESTGPGRFVVHAAPTEGLESLQVTFTAENPSELPFGVMYIDFSSDDNPDVIVNPSQFHDGQFSISATYAVGTWVSTIVFLDDLGRLLYSTQKSIVVRRAQTLQAKVMAVYDGMLTRLRAGNIPGAMTAFTGSAYEKYNQIFAQLQPSLAEIIDQLGTITEINFNLDMAELTLVRDTETGQQRFLIYLLRSEDGIWRIDGM